MSKTYQHWQNIPATPCGMIKIAQCPVFESLDRQETLSLLPSLSKLRILDLACGIGRFTTEFAKQASHLVCVDFMENYLSLNRQNHSQYNNIEFILSDVMEITFPNNSFDFVFANWIFLYLNKKATESLIDRIYSWLTPGGQAFFRETCAHQIILPSPENPSTYRPSSFYIHLFKQRFQIVKSGYFSCWLEYANQPFSCYWLVENASSSCIL